MADRPVTGGAMCAAAGAAVGSLLFGIGAIPGPLIGGCLGAATDGNDFNPGKPVYQWGTD